MCQTRCPHTGCMAKIRIISFPPPSPDVLVAFQMISHRMRSQAMMYDDYGVFKQTSHTWLKVNIIKGGSGDLGKLEIIY